MAKKEIEQTEIEAPYELPEGWKWCRLGEVADWGSGGTPSRKNPEYYQGSIPWIKTGELNETYIFDSEEKVSEDAIKHSSAKIFPKETVVMAMYGATIGKTAIFGIDASTNQACACAICHKELDNHFLFNFLKSKKDYFLYNAKGGAQPNISQEIIKNTPIPLPPTLAEQQRIVKRIESMFAKLDEAKERAQNVVDGFETRKAAILHKAFTGELTAKWRKENGVCDDSWKIVKLEDIVKKEKYSLKAGPFGSALKKEFYVQKGFKIYGQEQVLNSDENYGDYFIDEDKYNELESCKIAPNDILISLVGTIGKTLILSEKCKPGIINPRLIKISLDVNVMIPQFFTYYFGSDYCKSKYMAVQHGTTMDVLNMGILKQLEYPCCTLPEQVEIVRNLDIIIEKENKAKQAAEAVLEQIDLLKKSILARAFRGEL